MNEIFYVVSSIGCVFIVAVLLFFGFFAYLRYIRYKETITLAEKGLVHPGYGSNGKGTLRWGIAFTALGIALCMGLYPIGFAARSPFPLHFGPWMLAGLIPAFFGLSLVAIYYLTNEKKSSELKSPTQEEKVNLEEES
ncbi:MAG TPA: DUF6249 domain-containing protein [Anaerolineales bacterium]|nr:DUF6249 domain-containing protein [Anaerolineales bacterium]